MQACIESAAPPALESTSLPLVESTPAWTLRVPRPAEARRNELAQELRDVPKAALRQVFGRLLGTRLWQQGRLAATPAPTNASAVAATTASGVAAVKNSSEAECVSDAEISSGMLRYLCAEAAATLRERQRAAKSISLTVQYSDGELETAHQLLLESTNDLASLEAAARAAVRGLRSAAYVSVKLDLTATATQA
jgi:nucleotidyltransferase/DNA polymerase involved in DNA repair